VTDDSVLSRPEFMALAEEVFEAGGRRVAIHLRGRTTGSRRLLDLVLTLGPLARSSGAALFVNDRIDVALVSDVDGVHLGGGSLSPVVARALLGPKAWIGVSSHDVEEPTLGGADYAFLGTIYPTASHPNVLGIGTVGLKKAVSRALGAPILAIGGIGEGQVAGVMATGAYGVAAIRGIWAASRPGAAVRRYLEGVGNRRE